MAKHYAARIEGPNLDGLIQQILRMAEIDKGLKEPLRKGLKSWQAGVVARMKAEAPDDPETGESRISAALRAKAPVISRGRNRVYAGFVVDAARLGASADGKQTAGRGLAWSIVQHEDLTLRHRRGNAKYMERPLQASASKLEAVVEAAFEEIARSIGA